jgi:hypothetical protein
MLSVQCRAEAAQLGGARHHQAGRRNRLRLEDSCSELASVAQVGAEAGGQDKDRRRAVRQRTDRGSRRPPPPRTAEWMR